MKRFLGLDILCNAKGDVLPLKRADNLRFIELMNCSSSPKMAMSSFLRNITWSEFFTDSECKTPSRRHRQCQQTSNFIKATPGAPSRAH